MRNTNRLCREWLLENNYDFIWLKPHYDSRKKQFKDFFYTRKDGKTYAQDIFNLFDGICFDDMGYLVFLQISTTHYHTGEPYHIFMENKLGFKVLMMRAVKKKNRWVVQTKEINDHDMSFIIQNKP